MIRHGLITELRIIGASEAANLIIDMKAKLENERSDLAAAHTEIEQLKKWRFDVSEGIGFCNRTWGVAGYEVADAETITGFWKDREIERDHEVESARMFSQAWKWWAKKRRRDLKWADHRLVEVLNKNIELGKDLAAAREEVESCHAIIKSKNAMRCDGCKYFTGPKHVPFAKSSLGYCEYSDTVEIQDHYCKKYESKQRDPSAEQGGVG